MSAGWNWREAYAANKSAFYSQPFLLAITDGAVVREHFLIVDNTSIPVGSDSIESFDTLFKSFYVFEVEFPVPLDSFYNFFAGVVFECTHNIKPSVRARYSQLIACKN